MNASTLLFPATLDPALWFTRRVALAAALAALADWLFLDCSLGLSLPLFLGATSLAALTANRPRAGARARFAAFALLAIGLLALFEEVNQYSFLLALVGTALSAIIATSRDIGSWRACSSQLLAHLIGGPFRFVGDALHVMRLARRRNKKLRFIAAPLAWIMPALLLGVFLILFAAANPVIESWLVAIDLRALLNWLLSGRALFWLAIIGGVWPMLHIRARRKERATPTASTAPPRSAQSDDLFGEAAFLRSLVALNALFAVQSSLDLTYLWAGVALPRGAGYAEYAHRGAYPLVVTALLAAVIAIFAMRPNGPAESSRLIRPLVLAFVGQNVLLMLSALLRLDLYIAAYGLTYWRLAALIWFLLVALGLVLIVAQIVLAKPLSWLLETNAGALVATLYACCFFNFPFVVATYNVDHYIQSKETSRSLDRCYLVSLGPQAIPALDRVGWPLFQNSSESQRERMAKQARAEVSDWRSWTFRTWRLDQYLANNAQAPLERDGRVCWLYRF